MSPAGGNAQRRQVDMHAKTLFDMTDYSNTSIRRLCAASVTVAVFLFISPALAGSDLEVREAWVRATVPGQPVAGTYMTLKSASPLRLISARTEVARAAELHQMSLKDGVMRMRRLESLDLPAGHEVKLAPGGIHLMLLDLKRPLSAGEEIELYLVTRAPGQESRTTHIRVPVQTEPPR